ncbi:MAG: hypothetical protein H0V17_16900, partial [Deltaproteobacteria bacterium]|nr:hypothetical protein [Deltaproteobacteria bacterium]
MRDPVLAIWALYLMLVPIYVFSSGLPQPGDWIIIVLGPMVIRPWNGRLDPSMLQALRPLLLFTGYVIAANLMWSVVLNAWSIGLKNGFGLSPVFYIYNAFVFLVVLVLYRRYRTNLLWFTGKVILAALISQSLFALVFGGGVGRATLMFNNPNQLGYFALLSVNILFLLHRKKRVSTVELAVGSMFASYLALLSASKAALGGVALIALVGAVVRLRTTLIIVAVFAITFVVAEPMRDAFDQTITRFETDQSASFAEERGYDRIAEYPEYWALGAGEGAYNRYRHDSSLGAHEIHSSIGTLFFSYGFVGTLLFALFLWRVMAGSGFRTWSMILPSLAYGMTHQGLRTTLFWV